MSITQTTKLMVDSPDKAAQIAINVPELSTIEVTDRNDVVLTRAVATPAEPWSLYAGLYQSGSPMAVDPARYPLTVAVTYQAEGAIVPDVSVLMWTE